MTVLKCVFHILSLLQSSPVCLKDFLSRFNGALLAVLRAWKRHAIFIFEILGKLKKVQIKSLISHFALCSICTPANFSCPGMFPQYIACWWCPTYHPEAVGFLSEISLLQLLGNMGMRLSKALKFDLDQGQLGSRCFFINPKYGQIKSTQ